jgi:hypothetical protein
MTVDNSGQAMGQEGGSSGSAQTTGSTSADSGAGVANGQEGGGATSLGAGASNDPASIGGAAGAAAGSFTPNFKFKFMGADGKAQVEKEIDDFLKPLVKDSETEKKIKELHEKAYGLDFVKADRQTLKETNQKLSDELKNVYGTVEQISGFAKSGDFESFFQALNIPDEAVIRYALFKAQLAQNPQQAQAYQAQRQEFTRAQALEFQNRQLQQNLEHQSVVARTFELDSALARAEVGSLAQSFDVARGTPGAFRGLVIQIGQMRAAQGQDISAADAVKEAMAFANLSAPQQTQQQAQGQGATAGGRKETIPNLKGGRSSVSPVKSAPPKSLDDLKKLRATMLAQQ